MFTSNEGLVKPILSSYNNVEEKINTDILFIDDSIQNLLPILYNDRWDLYLQNNFYRQNLYSYLLSCNNSWVSGSGVKFFQQFIQCVNIYVFFYTYRIYKLLILMLYYLINNAYFFFMQFYSGSSSHYRILIKTI